MGTAVRGGIDRPLLEKRWANYEARQTLSAEDRGLWDACQYTVRPYVYFNKVLIAWSVVQGQPQIKEIYRVVGLDVSFQDGIWLRMHAEVARRDVTINHVPRKLPGADVIAWVPYFNEVRFCSPDWDDPDANRNLRLHACFKMRDRADTQGAFIQEGRDHLSELHVFRALWPTYKDVRF